MRILGIDPGTHKTGWGVVERKGTRVVGVASDVITVSRSAPLEQRLCKIHQRLSEVIQEHSPDTVAVEDIFFAKYANAALKLGHARGVAILAAAQADLGVISYPPAVVKRTVVGRGRASKEQVAQLVGAILRLRELPPVDATDALAVAITHALASPLSEKANTARRQVDK